MTSKESTSASRPPPRKFTEVSLNEDFLIKAPDGGWGWVIVVASLMSNLLIDGVLFNVGQVFQPIWVDYFHTSVSVAAWAVSILVAFYYLAGPFTGCLINVLGCRAVSIIGVVLVCVGFVCSIFATSIYYLYFTLGFISGTGMGMVYLSSVIVVNYYFEKKRAMATGIAVCGSGLGAMTFGPLLTFLNDCFGWQGALLIVTGITMNCFACSLIYIPLKPSNAQIEKFEKSVWQQLQKESIPYLKAKGNTVPKDFVLKELDTEGNLRKLSVDTIMKINSPFNRKDIFYRSSSFALERQLSEQAVDSIVAALPELTEEEPIALTPKLSDIMKSAKATFKEMLDMKLLLSPTYITWAIQGSFFYFATMIPFIYLPAMAIKLGHSKGSSTMLISVIGAPRINAQHLQNSAILVGSVGTLLLPLMTAYWSLVIYCCLFGVGLGKKHHFCFVFRFLRFFHTCMSLIKILINHGNHESCFRTKYL
ncbi:unnamed protein product [Soboliphyme baturini]|uniref:MFS domain-containing protein n=1 Tax=Soboliphyme baturini TaxID=241478 RepID=A0A183IC12_9BILA|nr:unnamed protein product [Soboliphyme baturini]